MAASNTVSHSCQHRRRAWSMLAGMNDAIRAHGIQMERLRGHWQGEPDDLGNEPETYASKESFPLRCCLTRSAPGDPLLLLSHRPLPAANAWSEVGPVFIHAEPCGGFSGQVLPARLRTGPRVLRSYRGDGSLDYDGIVDVERGADIESALRELLADPAHHEVHVRAHPTQCFLYTVTREGDRPLGPA